MLNANIFSSVHPLNYSLFFCNSREGKYASPKYQMVQAELPVEVTQIIKAPLRKRVRKKAINTERNLYRQESWSEREKEREKNN